jgi:hypothetical protein
MPHRKDSGIIASDFVGAVALRISRPQSTRIHLLWAALRKIM